MANTASDNPRVGRKPIREFALQSIVLLMSAWWTSNGPAAFSINADFSLHPLRAVTAHVLVVPVTVNGWHALFHLVTGLLGLALGWRYQSAVVFAILSGVLYLIVATLGLVDGSSVLGVLAVDTFGNWVHAVEGLIMLSAGLLAVFTAGRTACSHNPRARCAPARVSVKPFIPRAFCALRDHQLRVRARN